MTAKKKRKKKVAVKKQPIRKPGRTASGRKTKAYRPYKPRAKKKTGGYTEFVSILSAELKRQDITLHEGRGGIFKVAGFMWNDFKTKGIPFSDVKKGIEYILQEYVSRAGKIEKSDLGKLAKQLKKRCFAQWQGSSEWWLALKNTENTIDFPEYEQGAARINFYDNAGETIQVEGKSDFRSKVWRQLDHWINVEKEYSSSDVLLVLEDVEIKATHLEINIRIENFYFSKESVPEKRESEKKPIQIKLSKEQEAEIDRKVEEASKLDPEEKQIRMMELEIKKDIEINKRLDYVLRLLDKGYTKQEIDEIMKSNLKFGK